jgi:hypothetical protein
VPLERWSPAQVAALAPDPAALKGARTVAAASHWPASGRFQDVLWGLCRGSGKAPYQVAVDLDGPAYKCTCPSRKFPCKHALGLMLLWAEGGGAHPADPPAWVAEWQATRASRVKAAATRASGPPDPAAAAKRAQQRSERVASGVAELRQWLDDQVQQGLAGFTASGHQPFEAMAARLVDAQAPAAAASVRRLGSIAGVGPQWADRLLGELGLLRLLVSAYERVDTLPDPLAATVRTRIGFPVASDDVLAGPRVRDRWQVLGQVDSDDGMLMSRRVWLRGEGTGRFALVLTFAAAGQSLGSDLLAGTELNADLCFYPGALPMRALVAERISAAEPLAEPSGAQSLRATLGRWSAALAAEPWRYDVPVLLDSVVPSGDGWLADTAGEALPLAPGHREPWWLLAAAGAQPATVAAEWSPNGLRPLAAWVDGRYVPAGPPAPEFGVHRPAELPGELLASALVGTARRPRTGSLLEEAAVALVYRRAGLLPSEGHAPVPPAPAETDPPFPSAAGERLRRILSGATPGGAQAGSELLGQWLGAAVLHGGRVPPDALPDLLDAGRRNATIRPSVARVAGRRGAWLADMRVDWAWLLDEAPGDAVPDDPAIWETGTGGARLAYLSQLRHRDPSAARELLEAGWAGEASDDRARLLTVLDTALSPADDPFLESVLDDRRREVRETALDLLQRMPGSALGARMAARARAAVRLERRAFGRDRLAVEPPPDLDAELRRDGVSAAPARGAGIGAWLLEEIVAGTPLTVWTTDFGRGPAAILDLARGHDWETPLLHGWAKAAITQEDSAWASALVANDAHNQAAGLREAVRWDLHLLLPPDELARIAADFLRREDHLANRLLALHTGDWPPELAVTVIETIARRARTDRHSWQLAELCRSAALAMPPAYAPHLDRLATQLDQEPADSSRVRPVAELARTLTFRHEMLLELA